MSTVAAPTPPPPPSAPSSVLPPAVRRGATLLGVLVSLVLVVYGALGVLDLLAWSTTTQRASYAGVRSLRVSLDAGRVELVRAPRGARLQVTARVRRGLRSPEVRQQLVDGRLALDGGCPAVLSVACDVRWRVAVPDGTAVAVDSSGGDVTLDALRVPGTLTVSASAGDVRVRDLQARSVRASSSAGDVEVDFAVVPDDVRVDSSAGDVRVTVPAGVYAVNASSSAGSTQVDVPQDDASPHRLLVSSSAGDVRVRRR